MSAEASVDIYQSFGAPVELTDEFANKLKTQTFTWIQCRFASKRWHAVKRTA
jgi:hypothetical protein